MKGDWGEMEKGSTHSDTYVSLQTMKELMGTISRSAYTTAGFTIGIIAVKGKAPGFCNVSAIRTTIRLEKNIHQLRH